jgi:pimeloyl-ACP methyl ester carboxylesterase
MWEAQHVFAECGWHVVMPQFRGFDCVKPDGADAASIDDYAEDVAGILETLGVNQAVVCGVSMGGYVAFALYRQAPQHFQALVLSDTRADADTADARAGRERLIALATSGGSEAIAADMVPKLLGQTTRATQPLIEARVRTLIGATLPSAMTAALRAMMRRPDSTALLPTVGVPTLVMAGEEDGLAPPAIAQAMAAAIPRADVAVIPAAGHLACLEQPGVFNAALLHFLDRL